MENEKPKIQVLDVNTQQVLFETAIDRSEEAYRFAAEMEEMGLDVKISSPTLAQTLTNSLGYSQETMNDYLESMNHELEHHEGSCCVDSSDFEQ